MHGHAISESPAGSPPPDIRQSYEAYGCKVNNISPGELFQFYAKAGFLYPAKMGHLAPFLPLVKENWRRALRGGELILSCVANEPRTADDWATVTVWRTTNRGVHSQHLVSKGGPQCSRAVMLATQAMCIHDCFLHSGQNWFRPENRFPARVFGTLSESISPIHSAVSTLNLFALPLRFRAKTNGFLVAPEHRNGKVSGLYALAEQTRGSVYAQAEEIGQDDLLLDALDQLYCLVGLRRYRRVWLAWKRGDDTPVAAAIAYRGPLGFNFSFLENRCDLLISPTLPDDAISDVALPLLAEAANAYEDFPPRAIPLIVDDRAAPSLRQAGASFMRQYCQSIWLRDGFLGWYRHVERFYERVIHAHRCRGLGQQQVTATTVNPDPPTA